MKKKNITTRQVLRDWENDPNYPQQLAERERQREEAVRRIREDSAPLIKELAAAGFDYPDLHALVHSGTKYPEAVPILLKWLTRVRNFDLKESIVRTLSVPWASPAAVHPLLEEFRQYEPSHDSYYWAVGNALWVVANPSVVSEMLQIAGDKRFQRARQMIVLALGRLKDPRIVRVLTGLLTDRDVLAHAVIALGRQGDPDSLSHLRPFLLDENSYVRQEARKAVARIEKGILAHDKRPSRRRAQ